MKRRIYVPTGDSGILQPIEKGGTNASNAKQAAKNLNLLTYDDLNKPNNAVLLNAGGFIDKEYLPYSYRAGNKPLLDGVFYTYPNSVLYLRITNFDSFTTYDLGAHMGVVSRNYDTLAFTAGPDIGAAWITVNGHKFPIEIRIPRVNKPVIVYPVANAENTPRGRFSARATDFLVSAYEDEHVSSDWQLSRNQDFSDLIVNNINDRVNKTNIQIPELLPERTYYLRVRYTAKKALQSEWSDVCKFTTTSGVLRGREIQKIVNDRRGDDNFGLAISYAPDAQSLQIGSPARNVSLNFECGGIAQYSRETGLFVKKHNIECFSQSKKLDLSIAPSGYVTIHYPEIDVSDTYLSSQTVRTRTGIRTVVLEGQGEHLTERVVPGRVFTWSNYSSPPNRSSEVSIPRGITKLKIEASYYPGSSGYTRRYYRVQSVIVGSGRTTRADQSTGGLDKHLRDHSGTVYGSHSDGLNQTHRYTVTDRNPINQELSETALNYTKTIGGLTARVETLYDTHSPLYGNIQVGSQQVRVKFTGEVKGVQNFSSSPYEGSLGSIRGNRDISSVSFTMRSYCDTATNNQFVFREISSATFTSRLSVNVSRTESVSGSSPDYPVIRYLVGSESIDLFSQLRLNSNFYAGPDAGYITLPKEGENKRVFVDVKNISNELSQSGSAGRATVRIEYSPIREPYAVVKPEVTGNGNIEIPVGTREISVTAKANDSGEETTFSINGEQKVWSTKGYSSKSWDMRGLGGTLTYTIANGTVANIAYVSNEDAPQITTHKFSNRQGSFTVPAGVTQVNIWAKLPPKTTNSLGEDVLGGTGGLDGTGTVSVAKPINIKRDGVLVVSFRRGRGYEDRNIERETIILEDDNQPKNFSYELPPESEITVEYATKDLVAKPTTIRSENLSYSFGGGIAGLAKPSSRVFHMEERSFFGYSTSINKDGTVMVTGAPGRTNFIVSEDDFHADPTRKTGSVFIYHKQGDNWNIRDVIEPGTNDAQGTSFFGASVSVSDDGNTLVIGTPLFDFNKKADTGRVEVFTYRTEHNKYMRESEYTSPLNQDHDMLGYCVAIHGDKSIVAASAPGTDEGIKNSGCVYVDVRISGRFERRKIRPQDPEAEAFFGTSIALCRDGRHLAVGAPGCSNGQGAIYLFRRDENSAEWTQIAKIANPTPVENERLGTSVAITDDAATIAAGAPGKEGRAFNHPDGPWVNSTKTVESAAYVFRKIPTGWELGRKIVPSDRTSNNSKGVGFGASIAFSPTGDLLMVGVPNDSIIGAVYVYD